MKLFLCLCLFSLTALAQNQKNPYGDLTPQEQKYYKNEAGMGMNQLERIDSTVREINKLHGEIATLKAEVQSLKQEMEELKKSK